MCLDVIRKNHVSDGIIVENCDEFDGVLSDYVIVCQEYNIDAVKKWISENVKSNVEHCLKMFLNKPEKIMKFILVSKGCKSLTMYFVQKCGGIQGFLDKYGVQQEPTPQVKEDEGEELQQIPDNPKISIPTEEESVLHTLTFESDSDKAEMVVEEECLQSEDVVEALEEKLQGECQEKVVEEGVLSEEPVVLTADEQLQLMLKQQYAKDKRKQGLLCEEECLSEVEVQGAGKTSAEELGVATVETASLFHEDGSFATFSEEQYVEVVRTLHSMDQRISLDGLSVEDILQKEDIPLATEFLTHFAPGIFKQFFIHLADTAHSDKDFIRFTTILDDFAFYVKKKFGGR